MGGKAALGEKMKTIKSITIDFENCEWVTFPIFVLGVCHLGNICTTIDRVASNAIGKSIFAREIALEIFFPEAENECTKWELFDDRYTVLQRFTTYRDITHITLNYQDGSEETFVVDYEDEVKGQLGSNNKNQRNYVSECGNLYIVIDENKGIKDFFNTNFINDKKMIEFKKDMYRQETVMKIEAKYTITATYNFNDETFAREYPEVDRIKLAEDWIKEDFYRITNRVDNVLPVDYNVEIQFEEKK